MSKVIKKVLLDNCVLTRMFFHDWNDYSKEEERLKETKDLYEYIYKELKADIYISTIVLAECLQGIDSERHDDIINEINQKVSVLNFCSKSAQKCATIFQSHKEKGVTLERDNKNIKADIKILASAVVYNIDAIYTYDKDFAKLSTHANIDILLVDTNYPFQKQPLLV